MKNDYTPEAQLDTWERPVDSVRFSNFASVVVPELIDLACKASIKYEAMVTVRFLETWRTQNGPSFEDKAMSAFYLVRTTREYPVSCTVLAAAAWMMLTIAQEKNGNVEAVVVESASAVVRGINDARWAMGLPYDARIGQLLTQLYAYATNPGELVEG